MHAAFTGAMSAIAVATGMHVPDELVALFRR